MSTIYVGERQSGKTTKLIKESAETGAIIVCATPQMCKDVKFQALNMRLSIPDPIPWRTFIRNYVRKYDYGYEHNIPGYLIDELQMMLHQMNVKGATVDSKYVEALGVRNVKD